MSDDLDRARAAVEALAAAEPADRVAALEAAAHALDAALSATR